MGRSRRLRRAILALPAVVLVLATPCHAGEDPLAAHPVRTVALDIRNYYLDSSNLLRLGIGIAADAVPANTNLDRWVRDKYQGNIRSEGTDDAAKVVKVAGTALVTVPVYIGAYGAGYLFRTPTVTEWSQRSFRATLVGTPALLILQEAIGSDRPEDGNSHWKPFHSSHGVSGHAYIGAVPFITAAEMTETPYGKALFFAMSTLPGLSRINDDAHYFSQAALGWYLAYLGCRVVSKGNAAAVERAQFGIAPLPGGMALTMRRIF